MAKPDIPRVTYVEKPGGHYDVIIANPDASQLRIHGFPDHIQAAVQQDFHATLTLEETRKLRAAQDIGEPAYTAVWDDLISRRAADMLRAGPQSLPGTMENGRHELSPHHHPSYHEAELDR